MRNVPPKTALLTLGPLPVCDFLNTLLMVWIRRILYSHRGILIFPGMLYCAPLRYDRNKRRTPLSLYCKNGHAKNGTRGTTTNAAADIQEFNLRNLESLVTQQ